MFERKVEIIYGAIAGRPKKEVLAMLEWLMQKELEYENNPSLEEERGPFDAASWLKRWREKGDTKRFHKQLREQLPVERAILRGSGSATEQFDNLQE